MALNMPNLAQINKENVKIGEALTAVQANANIGAKKKTPVAINPIANPTQRPG